MNTNQLNSEETSRYEFQNGENLRSPIFEGRICHTEIFKLEFNKPTAQNSSEDYANIVVDDRWEYRKRTYEIENEDLRKLDEYEGYSIH